MVARYFQATAYPSEEIKAKTEQMLNESYQKVLTFQGADGCFGLWEGGTDPGLAYTALALAILADMSTVMYVDPAVIDKAVECLRKSQQQNGSFGDVMLTAAIAWALAEAGQGEDVLSPALAYLKSGTLGATLYTRAVTGLALHLAGDPAADQVADQIALKADESIPEQAFWEAGGNTLFAYYYDGGAVVATGLAVQLLAARGKADVLVQKGVAYLVASMGQYGTWGSTEDTVAALRALAAVDEYAVGKLVVSCQEQEIQTIDINQQTADLLHIVELDSCLEGPETQWSFTFDGVGTIQYQFEGWYNTEFVDEPPVPEFEVEVGYDPPDPTEGETVTATVAGANLSANDQGMTLLLLPVPLGMAVKGSLLDDLKEQGLIQEWETRDGRVVIYFNALPAGGKIDLAIDFVAVYPMKTVIPPATLYSYYTPDVRATSLPLSMEVK